MLYHVSGQDVLPCDRARSEYIVYSIQRDITITTMRCCTFKGLPRFNVFAGVISNKSIISTTTCYLVYTNLLLSLDVSIGQIVNYFLPDAVKIRREK